MARNAVNLVSLKSPGIIGRTLCLAVVLALLVPVAPAYANSAQDMFADGNRLYRDDLYWAALLRYRQAAEAGLQSPLLDYNMGVAHYKAGQHQRARTHLRQATRSSKLEIRAHYNLGLNAWKMGNTDEALGWLRKARDQEEDKKIRSLAVRAIGLIHEEATVEQPVLVRIEEEEEEKKNVTELLFSARLGAGMDSNVFRTPSAPYVDLSNPAQPVVTPEVQQGSFVPVNVSTKYILRTFDNEAFFGNYRLAGRYFPDEALQNGNEYAHELAFGSEFDKRSEHGRRQVYSAFTIAQHDEVYYNRDDGLSRSFQGTSIEDRFNYLRYGPEFWYRQKYKRFAFGLHAKGQLWNYEDTEVVPEYDHKYLRAGVNVQYRLTQTSLIRLTADAYQRHFGDRPSFELDGTQPAGNPAVEYDYIEYGFTARQRVTRGMWFGMDYRNRTREDGHVGYNNYVMDGFGAQIHINMGERFSFDAGAEYRIYDYENAFAFNNPAAGRKTLERGIGTAEFTFRMTQHFALIGEYRMELVESNDARIAYDRNTFFVSLRWDL